MTKERKEEILLGALVVSLVVHVACMFYAKPRVMTTVAAGIARFEPRGPMRVVKDAPRPDPVRIDAVADVKSLKEAPSATPVSAVPEIASAAPALPAARVALPEPKPVEIPKVEAPVFDVRPMPVDRKVSATIPIARIEAPGAAPAVPSAPPAFAPPKAVAARPVPALPAVGTNPDSVFLPTALPTTLKEEIRREEKAKAKSVFTPAAEVFRKVDESVVAEEKRAVKALVDADDAAELKAFVDVSLSAAVQGSWRYFRVKIRPRAELKPVPKDIVILIDASGSIGWDRITSIRQAARRILRSVTNSDDRFNLVAFRDRFSYAFRSWQGCTQAAFDRSDKWLANVAAHGRTDVFSTIRSVLTLPRDPQRPLVALVVTDGDANAGVSDTAEILSKFTALNDGLVSVYMYGVKSSANRELIDVLTHGNRGESLIFEGFRWKAGEGIEKLAERFRDPVLTDLRVVFGSETPAEAYPRLLRNLHRGDAVELVGRVPARTREVAFSLRGLNGAEAYEGFFRLPFAGAADDPAAVIAWKEEHGIDARLR